MKEIILSGLGGAIIAALLTVFLTEYIKSRPYRHTRALMKQALKIFITSDGDLVKSTATFNKFSVPQKRCFVVALHKIGVPVNFDITTFDLRNISFTEKSLSVKDLKSMIDQVDKGMLDMFFFRDVESYVDEVYCRNQQIWNEKVSKIK